MEAAVTGIIFGTLVPIIAVIGAFIMIVYIRKFENIERMAIIEKGLDPHMFRKDKSSPSPVLRWALLLIGAGLGLFVGYILDEAYRMEVAAYFGGIMVFGGLGLVIAYVIEEKKAKNNNP
jgi:hypothetical protein